MSSFLFSLSTQIRSPVIDYQLAHEDRISLADEITKPMNTLNAQNSIKPSKDDEFKEKKKDKTSDA